MGAALYIVLEKEIPGIDTMIDGKMLSKSEQHLTREAIGLSVRPLMEFFSVNPEEVASFLEEATEIEIPAEQWFSAEDGLKTVQALLSKVDTSPGLRDAKDDLLGFERVLQEAQRHEIKWHLAVDY